jgi:hypothetical protein
LVRKWHIDCRSYINRIHAIAFLLTIPAIQVDGNLRYICYLHPSLSKVFLAFFNTIVKTRYHSPFKRLQYLQLPPFPLLIIINPFITTKTASYISSIGAISRNKPSNLKSHCCIRFTMSIPSLKSQLLQELQCSLTPSPRSQPLTVPPPAYTYQSNNLQAAAHIVDDLVEPDMDATHSPINIKISSPITIIGDANLIAIDPAEIASGMANCIIRSVKDCSMARAGIPMIDEEGRPRPIDVQVDAGIIVRGTKNTIGKKEVLFSIRATRGSKRKREQMGDGNDEQPNAEGHAGQEREIDEGPKKQRVA